MATQVNSDELGRRIELSFTTDEADELLSVLLRKQVNADTVVMVNYALRHASDVAEAHLLARVMAFAQEGDWAAASTTASALESISKETYAPLSALLPEKQGAPDGVQEVHALALRIAHARGLDQTQSFLGPRGNKDMLKKREALSN